MIRKIGLLGGTFDPVHKGHVQLAEAAVVELGLEKVLFIPAAYPPHKRGEYITPFAHRVEMLRIALSGHQHIELSLIEGALPVPSYTIDTIRYLQANTAKDIDYYFIIGLDSFLDILNWKLYGELLSRIDLVVAVRSGVSDHSMHDIASALEYRRAGDIWYGREGMKDIRFLQKVPLAISSSEIRANLLRGCNCTGKIHKDVLAYIRQQQLYRVKRGKLKI